MDWMQLNGNKEKEFSSEGFTFTKVFLLPNTISWCWEESKSHIEKRWGLKRVETLLLQADFEGMS